MGSDGACLQGGGSGDDVLKSAADEIGTRAVSHAEAIIPDDTRDRGREQVSIGRLVRVAHGAGRGPARLVGRQADVYLYINT